MTQPSASGSGRPFTRATRLRTQAQFSVVREKGASAVGRMLVVRSLPAVDRQRRAAIVVSRRFSLRAVDRNRARRLLKEAYRPLFATLPLVWVTLIPRQALKGRTIHEVRPEVTRLLRQLGLLPVEG